MAYTNIPRDELVICLRKARREIINEATDKEWRGEHAGHLWGKVNDMTKRIESGERYEVLF